MNARSPELDESSSLRISNGFLIHLDRIYLERGGDLFKIMKLASIPYEALLGHGLMIPFKNHMRLLELSERELDVKPLGLVLATRQLVAHFIPIFGALLNQPNVELSILALCQNLQVVVEGLKTELRIEPDFAFLEISTNHEFLSQSSVFHDHAAGLLAQYLRWIIGKHFHIKSVSIPHSEPRDLQRFRSFFGCPTSFGDSRISICFDKAALSQPVLGSTNRFEREYNQVLEWDRHSRLMPKLRSVIREDISCGRVTVDFCASRLGLSKRTLQRRLEQHGTSFHKQLDSVRAGLARRYIDQHDTDLSVVAANLGYADQGCFTRAFQRWYRRPPSDWRLALAAYSQRNI